MIKEGKVPYRVFVIAGSEPLGSAGIQADVKAISACGGYAAGAITCVVDEDTEHVKDVCLIPVDMVVSQIQSLWRMSRPTVLRLECCIRKIWY